MEAEAVAHLQHPNIVQIFEVGEHGGLPYLSLELVEGGNLGRLLREGQLAPRAAAEMIAKLARAVHYIHGQHMLHRDLKPSNILLTADGTPKITDFGLARRLENDVGMTLSGAVLGTPSYMAPEQARGDKKAIAPAADVYALGAILYACLTGQPPFTGASVLDTLEQVRSREPEPPSRLRPGVPHDLDTICLHCLQKDPARRYASANALADDLELYLAGESIFARPRGTWSRLRHLWPFGKR
jgi:serine/threonine protein kinase